MWQRRIWRRGRSGGGEAESGEHLRGLNEAIADADAIWAADVAGGAGGAVGLAEFRGEGGVEGAGALGLAVGFGVEEEALEVGDGQALGAGAVAAVAHAAVVWREGGESGGEETSVVG